MELEANLTQHDLIYVDEAGFNLAKISLVCQVSGEQHNNVCCNFNHWVCPLSMPENLLIFLYELYQRLVPEAEKNQVGGNLRTFLIM